MTAQVKIEKQNFASGEVGRNVRAHTDLKLYQSGVESAENFVVLSEGVLTRTPGTRFIGALRNEAQIGRLIPFRYSGADNLMLVINDGFVRFIKNGAFLGAPYELSSIYTGADLELLRAVGVGNVLYLADGARGLPAQQLTRATDTSWTFTLYQPADGPFETQNLDKGKTISASGVAGVILLTGSGNPFQSGQEGAVLRLDESNLALTPEWRANENIAPVLEAVPAGAIFSDFFNQANAFDANTATDAVKPAAVNGLIGMSSSSRIRTAVVTASAGQGFCLNNPFVQLYLMGKVGAGPVSAFDGVQLATRIVTDAAGLSVVLTSNDQDTAFDHRWIVLVTAPADTFAVAEVTFDRVQAFGAQRRRWNGNVYDVLNNGNSADTPPTHTEGDAVHGTITWRYRHGPYGVVRITQLFSVNSAQATVLVTIPDSVVSQPTYRWYPPAWWSGPGFPDNVQLFNNRLSWTRKNRFWETAPNTPLSLQVGDDELSALAETLTQEDGTLPDIMWQMSSGILVLGARDGEWIVRGPSTFDPLTPSNIRVISDGSEGSCPQVPARLDGGVLFIGRDRKRLHFAKFDRLSETLTITEVSKASRHIVERGIYGVSWQRDPNRIGWVRTGAFGAERLAGVTLMPEDQIIGWHRHPMGRSAGGLPVDDGNNAVEDIATIPTSDEGRSDTLMIVRRIINGVPHRYVEQRMPFFQPLDPDNPTAAGAWFVDCGIRVTGTQLTSVTAAHLKGAQVRVFADGADRGFTGCDAVTGEVVLYPPADDVLVGLPIVARVRDLPRNVITPAGPSKAAQKRANHFTVDMVFSAGGKIRAYDAKRGDGGLFTALQTSGTQPFPGPVPLRTGSHSDSLSGSYGDEVRLELVCDNALPFTLAGLMPKTQIGDP